MSGIILDTRNTNIFNRLLNITILVFLSISKTEFNTSPTSYPGQKPGNHQTLLHLSPGPAYPDRP